MSKRYTEEEVALVLKRAAELQASEGGRADVRALTLAELEATAEEAGIDRALVRRAARELRRPAPVHAHSPLLGGPTHIRLERIIDGEVPVEVFELIVDEIRAHVGEIGTVSTLGRSLAWTSGQTLATTSARMVDVSVVPRAGKTTLRVEEKLGALIGGLYGGLFGGLGGGGSVIGFLPAALLGVPWLIPVTLSAWFGGVYMLTRRLYARKSRQREAQAMALMERMVELCEDAIG